MLITIWHRKYIAFASFYSSFNSALRNDNVISVWHKPTETSLMIRVNCCLRLATIVVSLLSVSCSTANRLPTSWTRLFLPVQGHFLCRLLCSPDLWRQFDSAKLDSDYSVLKLCSSMVFKQRQSCAGFCVKRNPFMPVFHYFHSYICPIFQTTPQ